MADKNGEEGDLGLKKYLKDNNIDDLREYIDNKIKGKQPDILVGI